MRLMESLVSKYDQVDMEEHKSLVVQVREGLNAYGTCIVDMAQGCVLWRN